MKLLLNTLMMLCCISKIAFAQQKREKELSQLKSLFRDEMSRKNFKDTNITYMFAFKVEVEKSHDSIVQVKNISVSDSSAYLIYKKTDFLKKINYSFWLGKNNSGVFVFPVAIFLESPTKPNARMVKSRDVSDKLLPFLYSTRSGSEPTENYIYIPAVIARISTIAIE